MRLLRLLQSLLSCTGKQEAGVPPASSQTVDLAAFAPPRTQPPASMVGFHMHTALVDT